MEVATWILSWWCNAHVFCRSLGVDISCDNRKRELLYWFCYVLFTTSPFNGARVFAIWDHLRLVHTDWHHACVDKTAPCRWSTGHVAHWGTCPVGSRRSQGWPTTSWRQIYQKERLESVRSLEHHSKRSPRSLWIFRTRCHHGVYQPCKRMRKVD